MSFDHGLAGFAPDLAAPDKLTVTSLNVSYHLGVISPAAAQQIAAVRAFRVLLAIAPPGAHDAPRRIDPAVVR